MKVKSLSLAGLLATPWTAAYQAPLSMGFSRQGYWSGLPFSSPGDLPNPGIELWSPELQADALPSESPGKSQPIPSSLLNYLFSRFQTPRSHLAKGSVQGSEVVLVF